MRKIILGLHLKKDILLLSLLVSIKQLPERLTVDHFESRLTSPEYYPIFHSNKLTRYVASYSNSSAKDEHLI